MIIQKQEKMNIARWFEAGASDYWAGLTIFSKYCNKKQLLNTLQRKESDKNMDKLKWELRKLADLPEAVYKNPNSVGKYFDFPEDDVPEVDLAKAGQRLTTNLRKDYQRKISGYPAIIRKAIKQKGDLHNKRDIMQKKLVKIPQDNKAENVKARAALLLEYDFLCKHIDKLNKVVKAYEEKGTVPSAKDIEPPKTKKEEKEQDFNKMDDVNLEKKLRNLSSNLTKQRNMLKYGKPSKQKEESPLPDGPKKDKALKKVAEYKTTIKTILDIKTKRLQAAKPKMETDVYESEKKSIEKRLSNLEE